MVVPGWILLLFAIWPILAFGAGLFIGLKLGQGTS